MDEKCCDIPLTESRLDFDIAKFNVIKPILAEQLIPVSYESKSIMICSPVGNQEKFRERKATVCISGYCTAPNAAICFLRDSVEFRKCKHTFDTPRMQKGLKAILETMKVPDGERTISEALDPEIRDGPAILFTQMLCMISDNGSAKAHLVEKVLKRSCIIRRQAESSLKAWYHRLNDCMDDGALVLLMGNNAGNLANHSYYVPDGDMVIDFSGSLRIQSLLDSLRHRFQVFQIIHAAGIAYKKNLENWLRNPNIGAISKELRKRLRHSPNK